jgi:CHAT domain-containing protein
MMKGLFAKIVSGIIAGALLAMAATAQPPGAPANAAQQKISTLVEEGLELRGRDARAALAKFMQAAQMYRAAGESYQECLALQEAGITHEKLDEKQAAFGLFQRAFLLVNKLRKDSTDEEILKTRSFTYFEVVTYHKVEGRLLARIGHLYNQTRETQKAIDAFREAADLCRRGLGNDARCLLSAQKGLAEAYLAIGERQKAFESLVESVGIKIAGGGGLPYGLDLWADNTRFGGPDSARREIIQRIDEALKLWTEVGLEQKDRSFFAQFDRPGFALTDLKTRLEGFRRKLSDGEGGRETKKDSVFAGERDELSNDISNTLESYGRKMARALRHKAAEAVLLSGLMRLEKDARQNPTAVFYGKQCINIYQELRRAARWIDAETQKELLGNVEADYRLLAEMLIEAGFFQQAEEVLQMLKEEEYSGFVKRDPEEIKNLARRLRLTEKEKALIQRYAQLAERPVAIGQELRTLEEKKALLIARGEPVSAADEKRLTELNAQLADANAAFKLFTDRVLKQELGADIKTNLAAERDLSDKFKNWGAGTVALYTVAGKDRYRVILTAPAAQVDGKTEIKSAELNRKIFAFREAMQNAEIDPRPLGKELYDILLKPIEKDLAAAGAKTLVWSLDGPLRYIPMAALSPDGKSYLAEKYNNAVVTGRTRDGLSAPDTDWRALGMGATTEQTISYPDAPGAKIKLAPLPGVKAELAAIIRSETAPNETGILPGRKFLDAEFTFENLAAALNEKEKHGSRKYKVVHFASHFRLGLTWSESFLLMGNGRLLTLETIGNSPEMDFSGVELVTLSACNTGLNLQSDGGEVDSLADAIQVKNGNAIMASLWEVVDQSTSYFMQNFYRIRKENPGLTKAEAVRQVQLMMLNGDSKTTDARVAQIRRGGKTANFSHDPARPYAHPIYWSAFVLIGNWR